MPRPPSQAQTYPRHGPAEACWRPVGRGEEPRASGQAAPIGRQRAAARRADQRPGRRHAARAGGRPRVVPRLRRRDQPRPLVWTGSRRTSWPSRATAGSASSRATSPTTRRSGLHRRRRPVRPPAPRSAPTSRRKPGRLSIRVSRPLRRPKSGKIAIKVINHYGDEVLKVINMSWSEMKTVIRVPAELVYELIWKGWSDRATMALRLQDALRLTRRSLLPRLRVPRRERASTRFDARC
jgi:hypothetical protein